MNIDPALPIALLTSVGGAMLVGIDRERRKGSGRRRSAIGLRTCVVVALLGTVSLAMGTGVFLVIGAGLVALTVVAYSRSHEADPGTTTEFALMLVFLLGGLAIDEPRLSAALFVLLAVVLAAKPSLHTFARQILRPAEIADGLKLAAATLIVLPLLPDRVVDPLGVLNPRQLWLFAILIMAINAAGYIALRLLGPGKGLRAAGFFGGFVSSTATINGMAQRARSDPNTRADCIAAALLANAASLLQLTIVLAAVAPTVLEHAALPLAAAGCCAAGVSVVAVIAAHRSRAADKPADLGRPLALRQAIVFVLIVSASLIAAALLQRWLGDGGVFVSAAVTGLADVHAATVGIGQLVAVSGIGVQEAALALASAYAGNAIVKCIAAGAGGASYAMPVIAAVALPTIVLVLTTWRA